MELDQRGARRLSATVTAFVIPRLVGKILQWRRIDEIIIAIAITAPTIRTRSCDDLISDFRLIRIGPSRCARLVGSAQRPQQQYSQDLDRAYIEHLSVPRDHRESLSRLIFPLISRDYFQSCLPRPQSSALKVGWSVAFLAILVAPMHFPSRRCSAHFRQMLARLFGKHWLPCGRWSRLQQ